MTEVDLFFQTVLGDASEVDRISISPELITWSFLQACIRSRVQAQVIQAVQWVPMESHHYEMLWQQFRQQMDDDLVGKVVAQTDSPERSRALLAMGALWEWLQDEAGEDLAAQATVLGLFLKLSNVTALGKRITPDPTLWNSPEIEPPYRDLYSDYMEHGWQHSTLSEMKEQYLSQFRSKPINPFKIRDCSRSEQIRMDLLESQWNMLRRYYYYCEIFCGLVKVELYPDFYTQMMAEMFRPLEPM